MRRSGDLDGMIADLAPTFEYVPTGAVFGSADVYRGPEGWTLKDGKVVRGQGFTRSDDALEAAGLSE
jgi:hypothetical protein